MFFSVLDELILSFSSFIFKLLKVADVLEYLEQENFLRSRAIQDFNGITPDDLTFSIGDEIWVILFFSIAQFRCF